MSAWESPTDGFSAQTAYEFERHVAAVYRALGADVQHDVAIAGSQIDVMVRERTSSGSLVRRAVECKAYSTAVGIDAVRSFAGLVHLLQSRGLIDAATVVAANGFSRHAREAADQFGVELLELADLTQRANAA